MSKIRVIFCGEKPLGLRCLQFLQSLGDVEIVAVCTRAKTQVWWGRQVLRDYCEEKQIPIIKRSDLERVEYDYLISVLYPFIIEAEHIARARRFAFNLHEAPLPRWRGCNGYAHAILKHDAVYGTTLHTMDAVLDTGEIIAMRQFPILPNETGKELYLRTASESFELFKEWVPRIFSNDFSPYTPSPDEASFLNPRDSLNSLKTLNPNLCLADAYRRARALDFSPWEPPYIVIDGIKYYLYIGDSVERKPDLLRAFQIIRASDIVGDLEFPAEGSAVIEGFPRPLVVCDENTYQDLYPIFTPGR